MRHHPQYIALGIGDAGNIGHGTIWVVARIGKGNSAIILKLFDGVVGGDLLQQLKAVIDYRRKQMRWRV